MKRNSLTYVGAAAVVVVITLWSLNLFLLRSYDFTDRGTFGDMFGAVNSLFSGLAFAGLIIAILLQTKELSLQRKELRLTREEFAGSREQLTKQNFERTFFQMITLHHELVNAIRFQHPAGMEEVAGRTALSQMNGVLTERRQAWQKDQATALETIKASYAAFYDAYHNLLGHYFRNLYQIVKFVHESDAENKAVYMGILRAQLSHAELVLLFYNGLSEKGERKFKPLIEQYGLLESLSKDRLFDKINDPQFYNTQAYGEGGS